MEAGGRRGRAGDVAGFREPVMPIWRRRNRAAEFERELQIHLELEAEEQRESGLSAADARHTARRAFGSPAYIQEEVRAVWRSEWLDALSRHAKYAARSLRKSPAFAVVAVLTLALGVGANTIIFSVVNALVLQPLTFPEADRLVRIYSTKVTGGAARSSDLFGPSPLDVRDFAQGNHTFERIVAYDTWRKNVGFGDAAVSEPEQLRVGLVAAEYFKTLGVQPVLGRFFTDEENLAGKHYVAAISAPLWRSRFSGDQAILGRRIRINDETYTIVAVMPDSIPEWMEPGRPGPVEVWTPFALPGIWSESGRGARGDAAIGRLKPGVSLEQAQADLSAIASGLAAAHPVDQGIGVAIRRLADTRVGELRPMLILLTGAMSLILLIACVNLANLLLARNSARQRELAVRAALGAGRRGLAVQLLAETLLLSVVGGAVGLALAGFGVATLTRMHPATLPQLGSIAIDWRVLAFALVVSLATTLLFGLAPALSGTRVDIVDALKQGGRSINSGPRSQRLRNALVVTEMAMALVLLVEASLFVQSIARLEGQHLGVRQDHLVKGHFYVPDVRYRGAGAITRFCDEFARRVRALPGVVDATVTTVYPPNNGWIQMMDLPGRPATRIQDVPTAQFGVADAHFLRTLGIPLVRGRDFAESDSDATMSVALISEEFKRRYFPSDDPIGRQIHIGPPPFVQTTPGATTADSSDVTIIGIVGDFKNAGLASPPEPQISVLYAQHPLVNYGFKDILVRAASDPRLLSAEIRRQLHALDPDMPFAEVQTMDELVQTQTGGQRFTTVWLILFALAGLSLAVVGVYGVISFLAAQRRQELAVRMAIGASRGGVFWLVLRQSIAIAVAGAAIGLVGAFAAQKLTSGILFGISPLDPLTFAGGALFLVGVAAIAGTIPSVRVMRIDPALTLRQD
jgi:predicted permease